MMTTPTPRPTTSTTSFPISNTTFITPVAENKYDTQIYTDVSNVYSKLQDYNTAYMNYVTCMERQPNIDGNSQYLRDASLNYTYTDRGCNEPDAAILLTQIQKLQNNIGQTTGNIQDVSYTNMVQTYNTVIQMRKDLDVKLQELYQMNHSVPATMHQETDAAIYATVLWATLATCLLYYIFSS